MDVRELGLGYGQIYLAQDRNQCRGLANTVMNLRFPESVGDYMSSSRTLGFSRRAYVYGVGDRLCAL
jgi:hypothetical protein